jgi:hypothetical protein
MADLLRFEVMFPPRSSWPRLGSAVFGHRRFGNDASLLWLGVPDQELIEHAIDKLGRLVGSKAPRQFNRFINRHALWRIRPQEFKGTQPQDVAIGSRHALQAPIRGTLGQQPIELVPVSADAGHERLGKFDELPVATQTPPQKSVGLRHRMGRIQIVLVDNLQGNFTRSASS